MVIKYFLSKTSKGYEVNRFLILISYKNVLLQLVLVSVILFCVCDNKVFVKNKINMTFTYMLKILIKVLYEYHDL